MNKYKNTFAYISIIGFIFSTMVLLVTLKCTNVKSIDELIRLIPSYIMLTFVFCMVSVLAILIVYLIMEFIDVSTIHTAVSILGNKLSSYVAMKNSEKIYPCLQMFLFTVLNNNRQALKLPQLQNVSSLSPRGVSVSVRNRCAFYQFELLSPEPPEYDLKMLQQIIQLYIEAEICNYGISGLNSVYKSGSGTYISVYLDRVHYDEANYTYKFDVVYVCTEQSAKYMAHAIKRDVPTAQKERDVYDDELQ